MYSNIYIINNHKIIIIIVKIIFFRLMIGKDNKGRGERFGIDFCRSVYDWDASYWVLGL